MKILFIGDIVGSPGRDAVRAIVPRLKKSEGIDFVIANAENAAGGSGITQRVANDLFQSGCNVLTAGDHIWRRVDVIDILRDDKRLIRPLNMPASAPGGGYNIYKTEAGDIIAVVSLIGKVFVEAMAESPFTVMRDILPTIQEEAKVIFVDFHAEATSEKVAMGWFLDGKVSCVAGTHTHVQTADERVSPKGTAYITDVGMSGPFDSVIGRNKDKIIERFLTGMPVRFELGTEDIRMQGIIVEVDAHSGRSLRIQRVNELLEIK